MLHAPPAVDRLPGSSNCVLDYFKDQTKGKKKGSIDLDQCEEITAALDSAHYQVSLLSLRRSSVVSKHARAVLQSEHVGTYEFMHVSQGLMLVSAHFVVSRLQLEKRTPSYSLGGCWHREAPLPVPPYLVRCGLFFELPLHK